MASGAFLKQFEDRITVVGRHGELMKGDLVGKNKVVASPAGSNVFHGGSGGLGAFDLAARRAAASAPAARGAEPRVRFGFGAGDFGFGAGDLGFGGGGGGATGSAAFGSGGGGALRFGAGDLGLGGSAADR